MIKPHVVILGAGFGGLTAARNLAGKAEVTLIDHHNFQTFLPLLYQVATAGLAADHVAYPIRSVFRKSGVVFKLGTPVAIDYGNQSITLKSKDIVYYDHLIFALGSATADFNIPGVIENTLGLKSISDAIKIRSTIMRQFETLCRLNNDGKLNITIVGGGPTGVEMAGALAELISGPLRNDQEFAAKKMKVNLIEAGPRLLPTFSSSLSNKTKVDLEKMGVTVLINTKVARVESNKILVGEEEIPSEITIWAAGVRGEPTAETLKLPMIKTRIDTTPTLQVRNYQNIWAIGDIAGLSDESGKLLPMVAPVALQQGAWVAKQIINLSNGRSVGEFKYKDKGSMATIGRNKAVVEVKKLKLTGVPAWFIWIFLHLFYLLGGRNKIGTFADWTWNYITFDRDNRHIMDND